MMLLGHLNSKDLWAVAKYLERRSLAMDYMAFAKEYYPTATILDLEVDFNWDDGQSIPYITDVIAKDAKGNIVDSVASEAFRQSLGLVDEDAIADALHDEIVEAVSTLPLSLELASEGCIVVNALPPEPEVLGDDPNGVQ